MDVRNDKLTMKIEEKCLSKVLEIATFKYEDHDLNRGRNYFSSNICILIAFIKKK